MSRERLREELIWGVATLLAVLLCVALLPFALLFVSVERLGGARRWLADRAGLSRAQ